MNVRNGFINTIGNTPLIKLKAASEATGCSILGKAEFLNPGGSVKDRAALAMVRDAEKRGALRPGGVLAIWSSQPDKKFTQRLRMIGFAVEEVRVRAHGTNRGTRHIIWIATRVTGT